MLRRVHSLFGGHCARVNRDRVFNGEVFDTPESLEAFEASQWNRDPTITPAPCAAPRWADADDRPSHSDSIMVAIGLDELCSFDGRPTQYVACVIFFAPKSPFNQTLVYVQEKIERVCIHDATEMLLRHRLELETAVRALHTVQHVILKVNPSIKQVVIKTSPFLLRTATVQLSTWEEPDGLLDANADRILNGKALLDLSRSIRGLENLGILVQFFPVLRSRNQQQAYAVGGHALLSKPWEPEPSAMHTASSVIKPEPSRAWNGERSNANLDVLIISLDPLPGQEYTPLMRRLFQASWRHKLAIDICAALHALEQIPATVLVTGTGILQPAARQLLKRLRKSVEDGAYVVFCYFLGDDAPTGYAFQEAFSSHFGLRWRLVPYRCLQFSPNPAAAIPIALGCLPHVYRPRGGLFEGVLRRSAVFLPSTHAHFSETLDGRGWVGCDVNVGPARDTAVSLPVPAAMASVGRGWVGVVGSICADGETDQIIYSMCGLD